MNRNTLAKDQSSTMFTVDGNPSVAFAFPSAVPSSRTAAKYGSRRKACTRT